MTGRVTKDWTDKYVAHVKPMENVMSLLKEAEAEILRREKMLVELVDLAVQFPFAPFSEKMLAFARACGHPGKLLNIEVNSWVTRRMADETAAKIAEAEKQERAAYNAYAELDHGRSVRQLEECVRGLLKGDKVSKKWARAQIEEWDARDKRDKRMKEVLGHG